MTMVRLGESGISQSRDVSKKLAVNRMATGLVSVQTTDQNAVSLNGLALPKFRLAADWLFSTGRQKWFKLPYSGPQVTPRWS